MTRYKISLRAKLHIAITGLALFITVSTVGLLYTGARDALLEHTRERLAYLAATTALSVNTKLLSTIDSREDESTPAYTQIKSMLKQIKEANRPEVEHIYTITPSGKPLLWKFLVDAEDDPALASHAGDTFDVSRRPEMQMGLLGPIADKKVVYERLDRMVSGYAPLFGRDNRPIGVVAVDMAVDHFHRDLAGMRTRSIISLAVGAVLALLLGTLLSSILMSPVSKLLERIKAAGQGDLETPLDMKRGDELGDVARTFNEMIESMRESQNKLIDQVNVDFLTGLYNHRYFLQRLENEVKRAERYGRTLSLLILDLDRFKLINDAYGHLAGDEILKQIGKLLSSRVREVDVVARYGGEEFTIILPETFVEAAEEVAEHIRQSIDLCTFVVPSPRSSGGIEYTQIQITACIGVASFPLHSTKADGVLMAAEIALYKAKHLARNRVCCYETSPQHGYSDPFEVHSLIQDPTLSTMEALAAAVDARDPYTRHHSENVSSYALRIGRAMGLSEEDLETLRIASLLHDVGKIGTPDNILNSTARLSDEERAIIQIHPSIGASIVQNSPSLDTVVPGILGHHERYDGSGYPQGLKGEEIPLLARIMAVADVFDALTTDRPYCKALSPEEAIAEIKQNAGTHFDPEVVAAFLDQFERQDDAQDLAA